MDNAWGRVFSFVRSSNHDGRVLSVLREFFRAFGVMPLEVESCMRSVAPRGLMRSFEFLAELIPQFHVPVSDAIFRNCIAEATSDDLALQVVTILLKYATIPSDPESSPLVTACRRGLLKTAQHIHRAVGPVTPWSRYVHLGKSLLFHAAAGKGGDVVGVVHWLLSDDCRCLWPEGDAGKFVWLRKPGRRFGAVFEDFMIHNPSVEMLELLLQYPPPAECRCPWSWVLYETINNLFYVANSSSFVFTAHHSRTLLAAIDYASRHCSRFDILVTAMDINPTHFSNYLRSFAHIANSNGTLSAPISVEIAHEISRFISALISRFPDIFTADYIDRFKAYIPTKILTAACMRWDDVVFVLMGWLRHDPRILHLVTKKQSCNQKQSCARFVRLPHNIVRLYFDNKTAPPRTSIFARLFKVPSFHGMHHLSTWLHALAGEDDLVMDAVASLIESAPSSGPIERRGGDPEPELGSWWRAERGGNWGESSTSSSAAVQSFGKFVVSRIIDPDLDLAASVGRKNLFAGQALNYSASLFCAMGVGAGAEAGPRGASNGMMALRLFQTCHPLLAHALYRHYRIDRHVHLFDRMRSDMGPVNRAVVVWMAPDGVTLDRWMALHFMRAARAKDTANLAAVTRELLRVVLLKLLIKERGGSRLVLGPKGRGWDAQHERNISTHTRNAHVLPLEASNAILSYCLFPVCWLNELCAQ